MSKRHRKHKESQSTPPPSEVKSVQAQLASDEPAAPTRSHQGDPPEKNSALTKLWKHVNSEANGIIAIMTIVLTITGVCQWKLTREQMHVSGRPWLVSAENPIGGPNEELLTLVVGSNRFYVWMFNGGDSPALETKSFGCAFIGPEPPANCSNPASAGGGVIGPGMKMWINFNEFTIGSEAMERVRRSEWRLWVVARVAYTDQFESTAGQHHPHETGMCLYADLGPTGAAGWKPCKSGNYAR